MTDLRHFEGVDLPGDAPPNNRTEGTLTRLLRPALELLDTRGGFQFAVICLCLASLAIGVVFQRSLNSVFHLPNGATGQILDAGQDALNELDEVLQRISAAPPSGPVSASLLSDIEGLSSRLAGIPDAAALGLPDGSKAEGQDLAAALLVARAEMLRELFVGPARGDVPVEKDRPPPSRLESELSATRSSLAVFLGEVSRSDLARDPGLASGPEVLTVWFWAFLLFSTLAGVVFLRLVRDEITQRQAREHAERRADFLAYFDPGTGLGNRFLLQDRLSGLIASGQPVAVLLVDIDNFRRFNDRYGRLSGDVVLREIAYRIQRHAEEKNGFAVRLSGDDFAVVMPDAMPETLFSIARLISSSCREPVVRAGQTLVSSVSIGAASFPGSSATEYPSYEQLMRSADFALESAKGRGGAGIGVYDDDLAKEFMNRKAMTESLPRAIAGRDLCVFFQPQVDLETGEIFGFEALIRWFGENGAISAADLIRTAEQGGLIEELDRYMIAESVRAVAEWNRRYRRDFKLSVNISALHLPDGGIVEFVASCLDRHAFPPGHLTLEITESAELDVDGDAHHVIADIRALGCRVSIDDFGTGYSSLGYLRRIGVDEIKIDRSFILGIEESQDARDFLESVLHLPESLGQAVIIEGIETAEQEAIVKALGARRIQGYLHGRPRPALEWLAEATYARRETRESPGPTSKFPMLSA